MITINKLLPCVQQRPYTLSCEGDGESELHVCVSAHVCSVSLAGCSWPLGSSGGCCFALLHTVFLLGILHCVTLTTGTLLEDKNICSLPLAQVRVSEVEPDFSKQVASNERQTLSLYELAIERGEKTCEISTVWG